MNEMMEGEEQKRNNMHDEDGGMKAGGSFVCRQSNTRWTPSSDQIRILKELYYNNGIRSPSADQIQRISARLRHYGKIEGKNVFYWFQNHKARERQKKRLTTTTPTPNDNINIIPTNNITINPAHWRSDYNNTYPCNITINTPPPPPPAAAGMIHSSPTTYGYGSMAMEQSFRECSISRKHDDDGVSNNIVACPYPFESEDEAREIATLPLFPMHAEDYGSESSNANNYYAAANCYFATSPTASLHLTLNSYPNQFY